MYKPRSIDTSHVKLPETITHLTERLAENNHDLWAQQRLAEGWTYGRRRDDVRKRHPDLKPYGEIPDSEKEYDRITALQTLKTILALGYRIVDPASDATVSADATNGEATAVLQRLCMTKAIEMERHSASWLVLTRTSGYWPWILMSGHASCVKPMTCTAKAIAWQSKETAATRLFITASTPPRPPGCSGRQRAPGVWHARSVSCVRQSYRQRPTTGCKLHWERLRSF